MVEEPAASLWAPLRSVMAHPLRPSAGSAYCRLCAIWLRLIGLAERGYLGIFQIACLTIGLVVAIYVAAIEGRSG